MRLNEPIEKVGEIRFLPVILTSLTALGGLIPLVLNPNPQIFPVALVLIGWLISFTILSRTVTLVKHLLKQDKVLYTLVLKTEFSSKK